jgi:hypothetical protein
MRPRKVLISQHIMHDIDNDDKDDGKVHSDKKLIMAMINQEGGKGVH